MQHKQPIPTVNIEEVMQIKSLSKLDDQELYLSLAAYINELILTNFERLVQLLYRIDVSEEKLKKLLRENPEADAGVIISSMIIERQKQKLMRSNEDNLQFNFEGSDEERL